MAKRTSMYLDGHTYSLFDPEEVHRDLRIDAARARAVMARSKGVAGMHEFCEECRDIDREIANGTTRATAGYATLDEAIVAHTERQAKYVVSRANLARMLQLGRGERIVRMWVSDDPQLLNVVIAGEHWKPTPDGAEIPVARMSRTQLDGRKDI